MGLLKEFRDFALKGNVLDMAVGVIIGIEFGKIVNSMINDLIMPGIGQVVGKIDFSDLKFVLQDGVAATTDSAGKAIAAVPEVAIRYGQFITVAINFFILAFCVFMVIKAFNTARQRFERDKAPPPPPPGPSNEEKLLIEIRDLLKAR